MACYDDERVIVEIAYDDRCKNPVCDFCCRETLNSEQEHSEDSNRDLSLVCTDEVQLFAFEELGRALTDKEIEVVESKIHKYIDIPESILMCIRERIADKE